LPNLSQKSSKGKSADGEESQGKKVTAAPPPKKEDNKENVNIVFIGRVGEWIYFDLLVYMCVT